MEILGPGGRRRAVGAAVHSLIFLLIFASYRPAVHLIAMVAAVANPHDAGEFGDGSGLAPRERKPKPTQQQSRPRIERVARASESRPRGRRVLFPGAPQSARRSGREGGLRPVASARVGSASLQPDYLQLFLPAAPHNHLSPPA